jgi:hypothetical protein
MTPDEMREYLSRKIIKQRADMTTAQRYVDGDQPMGWIDPEIARNLKGRIGPLNRLKRLTLLVDSLG